MVFLRQPRGEAIEQNVCACVCVCMCRCVLLYWQVVRNIGRISPVYEIHSVCRVFLNLIVIQSTKKYLMPPLFDGVAEEIIDLSSESSGSSGL